MAYIRAVVHMIADGISKYWSCYIRRLIRRVVTAWTIGIEGEFTTRVAECDRASGAAILMCVNGSGYC